MVQSDPSHMPRGFWNGLEDETASLELRRLQNRSRAVARQPAGEGLADMQDGCWGGSSQCATAESHGSLGSQAAANSSKSLLLKL